MYRNDNEITNREGSPSTWPSFARGSTARLNGAKKRENKKISNFAEARITSTFVDEANMDLKGDVESHGLDTHERGKGRDGNKEKPAKADVEGKTAQAKAKNVEHADGGSDEGDEFNSAGTKVEDDKNMKASNSQEERIS